MEIKTRVENSLAITYPETRLITYDPNYHVLLHNREENKVVIYNSKDKKLVALSSGLHANSRHYHRGNENIEEAKVQDPDECPLCHHRKEQLSPNSRNILTRSGGIHKEDNANNETNIISAPSFRNGDYFQLLEKYLEMEKGNTKGESNHGKMEAEYDPLSADQLNSGYYKRFFIEEQKIGSGGFGHVYKCRHVINNVELGTFAVKKVPVGDNQPWLTKVLTEVKALEYLKNHPNIINYSHSWLENEKVADFGPSVPCLFILMEYANGGSLASRIWSNPPLTEKEKILRMRRTKSTTLNDFDVNDPKLLSEDLIWSYICKGIHFLHERNIIHRDIKPQNILLTHDPHSGPNQMRCMISDFGTCTKKLEQLIGERTGNTGTMEYIAPELLLKEHGVPVNTCDEKSDIWGLGLILYAMTFSKLPFYYSNEEYYDPAKLEQEILSFQGVVFPRVHHRSQSLLSMLTALLLPDPKKRPTAAFILSTDFIASIAARLGKDIPTASELRSSRKDSIQISRIPSMIDDMAKREEEEKAVLRQRRNEAKLNEHTTPSSRKRLTSGGSLPHVMKNMNSLVVQSAYLILLMLRTWFCIDTCHVGLTHSPSYLHLFPSMLLSCVLLLMSNLNWKGTIWSMNALRLRYGIILFQFFWSLLFIIFADDCKVSRIGAHCQNILFSGMTLLAAYLFK